jgi:stage IV sporulation protein FB
MLILNKKIFYFKLQLDILFVLVIPIIICFDKFKEYGLAFFSIVMHEVSHIIVASIFGQRIYSIKILPMGFSANIDGELGNRLFKIFVLLAGPLINILLCGLFLIISSNFSFQKDTITMLFLINFYLFILNILPVLPLDGGNIIRELLAIKYGLFLSNTYTTCISKVVLVIIMILGLFQVIYNNYNFSLIFIGLFILLSIKHEHVEVKMMNIKQIICRKTRVLKKGIYPARELVVVKNMRLDDVMKSFDFDRFHILYVLDEELALIKVITEQDVFNGLIKNNPDITIEGLIADHVD